MLNEIKMLIKGLQKLSMIDYPGKAASVVFLFGCSFKCGFCHNPELLDFELSKGNKSYSEEEILKHLNDNLGFLDGVVITGGEPTINADLPEFVKKIYELGLKVKLDTNGTNPEMLKLFLDNRHVDFVAMDIKASFENYDKITCSKVDIETIKKSIDLVKKFPDYEFRITIAPGITKDDILKISEYMKSKNANKVLAIQQFRPGKTFDKSLDIYHETSEYILKDFAEIARQYFEKVIIRKE